MTSNPMPLALRLIFSIMICSLLVSCGSNDNSAERDGEKIAYQLRWPSAKAASSIPSGVVTVRMSVSSPDMTTISRDFAASAGSGSITDVPVGNNRTVTFQGLNSSSVVIYQATVSGVTLASGQTYDCGKVTMTAVGVGAVPADPSGLSATAASSSEINLAWTDNSGNESGFKIERKVGTAGTYSQIAVTAANAVSYTDTGLTSSTTYYYRIRATASAGDSGYSAESGATTQGTATTVPVAPSGLSATPVSYSQINLVWVDNSNNENGFKIERKAGTGGTYTQIGTVAANVTSYSDTGLIPSTTYYYRVRAGSSVGDSGYGNESGATTSATNLRFIDRGNGTVYDTVSSLTWLKNANCFDFQTWDNAIARSNNLASGQCGLSDGSRAGTWHLATIDELRTFVPAGYASPQLNAAGFLNVQPDNYWSSSTDPTFPQNAKTLHLYQLSEGLSTKTNNHYVWPVHSGQ